MTTDHTPMSSRIVSVSFGGGTNSAAMVIGMLERGERIDYVLFADTGGERPETYQFIGRFGKWMDQFGLALTIVSNGGRGQGASLEENCLIRHELPSLAYGFKGCSVKWKRQPMDRYLRGRPDVVAAWERGELVTRCIGIDAGETRRRRLPPDAKWTYRYPLVEWGWDRDACVSAIARAGLPQPGKSSCFFCPAMREAEVIALSNDHPDLFARAVAIERNSHAHTIKGLGRRRSWEQIASDAHNPVDTEETKPCDCADDGDD